MYCCSAGVYRAGKEAESGTELALSSSVDRRPRTVAVEGLSAGTSSSSSTVVAPVEWQDFLVRVWLQSWSWCVRVSRDPA